MTTNQQRAAEILRDDKHYRMGPHGEKFLTSTAAQALADAGLIAPDLPKPAYEGSTPWHVPGEHDWQTDTYKGKVMLVVDIDENYRRPKEWFMKPDEARALAMAILAAADYAEKAETHE